MRFQYVTAGSGLAGASSVNAEARRRCLPRPSARGRSRFTRDVSGRGYTFPAPSPCSFIFRQSVVREMPSRRALSEMFPFRSASTRAMCARSTSARLHAAGYPWSNPATAGHPPRRPRPPIASVRRLPPRRQEERAAARAERRGQVLERDRVPLGEDHRALDRVLELAHVAGVVVAHEGDLRVRGEALTSLPSLTLKRSAKYAARMGMSSRRSRSGGSSRWNDIETVEEVLAERALARPSPSGSRIGRRDHADVDVRGSPRADRAHLARPPGRAAAAPGGEADISPTSSRKSVPPLGLLEQPAPVAVGAGERAAHVAEQLALDQVLGKRAGVDRQEDLVRARC